MKKKKKYETYFVCIEILCNLLKKKLSHTDLSIWNYGLLKFKLQKCVNNKSKWKRQELNYNFKI